MWENIRTISDIAHLINRRTLCGTILLIDFEKAFHSLEWEYLRQVLKAYQLRHDFIPGSSYYVETAVVV